MNEEGVPVEPCAALGSGFDMRNTDIQNPSDMKNRDKSTFREMHCAEHVRFVFA